MNALDLKKPLRFQALNVDSTFKIYMHAELFQVIPNTTERNIITDTYVSEYL